MVLGLIFVGLEIRQNTNAVKGATLQAIAEMSQENSMILAQDDELSEAYRLARTVGIDTLTPHQTEILSAYTSGAVRPMEMRFRSVDLGILDRDEILASGGGAAFYRTYWFRYWWEQRGRASQPSDFGAWLDAEVLPLAATEPTNQ